MHKQQSIISFLHIFSEQEILSSGNLHPLAIQPISIYPTDIVFFVFTYAFSSYFNIPEEKQSNVF